MKRRWEAVRGEQVYVSHHVRDRWGSEIHLFVKRESIIGFTTIHGRRGNYHFRMCAPGSKAQRYHDKSKVENLNSDVQCVCYLNSAVKVVTSMILCRIEKLAF